MQYIERTLQVKDALLEQPHLLKIVRSIFDARIETNVQAPRPFGKGNSRWAYEIGQCPVNDNQHVSIILKLCPGTDGHQRTFSEATRRGEFSEWNEFGVYELYYDHIVGHIEKVRFKSPSAFKQYKRGYPWNLSPVPEFSLADRWGGTSIEVGDLGAVPYFQLAVCYRGRYGILTEGLPTLIKPEYTAYADNLDDFTVEQGRIIDMGASNSHLHTMNQGGTTLDFGKRHPDLLGIYKRGEKYFTKVNRLDLKKR